MIVHRGKGGWRGWRAIVRDPRVWLAFVAVAAMAAAMAASSARAGDQTPLKSVQAPNGPTYPANFQSGDTVGVPHGGTGATSLTIHCVLIGQGTSAVAVACPSSAGQVLTDNGASSDPSFQAAGGGAPCTTTASSLQYDAAGVLGCVAGVTSNGTAATFAANALILGGASSGTLKLNCAAACGTNTLTFPAGTTDFSATGGAHEFVKQASAGAAFTVVQPACADLSDATFCNVSQTNGITLGNLAQIGANTVLGNPTGSTANAQAESLTDCHGASNAVTYTAGIGWGCNTISTGGGGGTVTVISLPRPGGRLTLVSGSPVLTSDQTAKSTVYYDCAPAEGGGNSVTYYDGSTDQVETISGCEVSLTMVAGASTVGGDNTTTGGINNAGVFDIWWVHGGANRICIANGAASSHSGGGWSSDTGGSATARGTGYSQVHDTRGYWTNANSIAHCWNGSTDYGSVSADQATYLGTLTTTAAGQTGVQFTPAPAGGGNNTFVGIWNAYNRSRIITYSQDNTASWTYASATWRSADNSNSNRITVVDGLARSPYRAQYQNFDTNPSASNCGIGIDLDSTSATPAFVAQNASTVAIPVVAQDSFAPAIGLHFVQAVEARTFGSGTCTYRGSNVGQNMRLELEWDY